MLNQGEKIGKYVIEEIIGKGGTATVYRVRDLRLGRQWAMKEICISGEREGQEKVSERILWETTLLGRLDHPAFPRVVDQMERKESHLIIMDYVSGRSLREVLKEEGIQKEETILVWLQQLLSALAYLHSRKPPVIYRDLKLTNILLDKEGRIRLVDLGIAREYRSGVLEDTQQLGTKGYAAPEQYGGGQSDERTDIYALGICMIELLTGIHPLHDPYRFSAHPLHRLFGVSRELEAVLNRCTNMDPQKRYQSCLELKKDLAALQSADGDTEKSGGRYRRIMRIFFFLAGVNFCLGIFAFFCAENVREKVQTSLLTAETRSYAERAAVYKRAVQIQENNPEGYRKLLSLYCEDGELTENEEGDIRSYYTVCAANLVRGGETDWLNFAYEAGIALFYPNVRNGTSLRTRILKAEPFFHLVAVYGKTTEMDLGREAEQYLMLGQFYTKYVQSAAEPKEPGKADYLQFLRSISALFTKAEAGGRGQGTEENVAEGGKEIKKAGQEGWHIRLLLCSEWLGVLRESRKGIAASGVEKQIVKEVLDLVEGWVESCPATQIQTVETKEAVCHMICQIRIEVQATYHALVTQVQDGN